MQMTDTGNVACSQSQHVAFTSKAAVICYKNAEAVNLEKKTYLSIHI